MEIDAGLVLKIFAVCVAILGLLWGINKWMIKRIDDKHTEVMGHVETLHSRVNEVKDNYVRRVDLDRDLYNVNNSLDSIKGDMARYHSEVNQRLDKLLLVMSGKNPTNNE